MAILSDAFRDYASALKFILNARFKSSDFISGLCRGGGDSNPWVFNTINGYFTHFLGAISGDIVMVPVNKR